MLNYEKKKEIAGRVEKHLSNNGLYAEVSWDNDLPVIIVYISRGDWKHDHLRCDHLVDLLLPDSLLLKEEVIEEDGSDCYSSEHYYIVRM